MAGYIGNIPTPQATQTRDHFTVGSGTQSSFSTQGYTPGYIDVFLNGSHLDVTDYTATDGVTVVLDDAAERDDVLTIVSYSTFEVADTYTTTQIDTKVKPFNDVFFQNSATLTSIYTIPTGQNAGTFGPITINDGVTVTVPDGSEWTIV